MCIKRTLVIKFHHPTCRTPKKGKDYLELPPTTFSIFTLKNGTWRTYLISFTVQYCFLFRFVWIAIYMYVLWYYDQLVLFDKEINANVYRESLWQYSSHFHCSFEWHLTSVRHYLSKPVLGGHPVLSRHYSIPRGCPLNTGFNCSFFEKQYCYFIIL